MVSHLAFSKSVKMTQIVKSDIFKNYKIIIKSIIYKVNIKTYRMTLKPLTDIVTDTQSQIQIKRVYL